MNPHSVTLTVTFHGPFHIGGSAQAGLDRSLDREVLLPATSIKGLLRAEARERLRVNDALVTQAFGAAGGQPSPWWFSDATLAPDRLSLKRHARIRRDENGLTERAFLMVGEEVWATTATCTIEPISKAATSEQRLVLRAAARSVRSLGGGRRRGSGWVSITDDEDWTLTNTQTLLSLRGTL